VQSGGGWSADGKTLPGVLDLETNGSDSSGACFGMTPDQLTSWTADFTQTYKNLTGRDAVIYTAYYFWQNCMGGTSAFSQSNPLWIAAYGAPANDVWMPGNWPQFTFWQYNDGAGTFPGDQNLFNGSYAQLQTLALGYKAQASRVAGPDRIGTALVAAGKIFSTDGQAVSADGSNVKPGAKYVYLTRDDDYPDALSVGPLAAKNKGAVLVTPPGSLDARITAFLGGLKAAGVDVHLSLVGGTDAVSDAVASAAAQALGTASAVGRIQGADRYATSLAIANLVSPVSGANGDVFLATGRDFADALTAGAAAARNASSSDPTVATAISPVLLTDGSSLSAAAQGYVAAKSVGAKVYAVGGATAQAYPGAVLLSGSDRYETAAKVAQQFWTVRSTDVNTLNVGIASGFTFADAVIGASYMAQNNGPLLLTGAGSLSSPTSSYLNTNRGAIGTVFIFGGSVTISSNVAAQAASALSF
jgi:putative cell wall-binding protein